MRKFALAAAAVLAFAPLPASAQELCASLGRIVRSAGEPTPFASLARAAAEGEVLVPGFGPMCWVAPGEAIVCWRNVAPESLEVATLVPAIHDCLGLPAPRPDPNGRAASFVASGLRFEMNNRCSQMCSTGLTASLRVALASPF